MSLIFLFLDKDGKCLTFSFPKLEYELNLYKKKREMIDIVKVKDIFLSKFTIEMYFSKSLCKMISNKIYDRFFNMKMEELNEIGEMLEILDLHYPEKFLEIKQDDILKYNIEDILRKILLEIDDDCIPKRLLEEKV